MLPTTDTCGRAPHRWYHSDQTFPRCGAIMPPFLTWCHPNMYRRKQQMRGFTKRTLVWKDNHNASHGFRSSSKHFLSKYRDASTRSPFPHLFFFLFSTLTKKVNKFINPLIFSISFLFLLASNKQWPILYLVSKEPTLL